MRHSFVLTAIVMAATGCQQNSTPTYHLRDETAVEPATPRFVAKAWKALGDGSSLTDAAIIAELSSLSRGEVVDRLLDQPGFGDSVQGFNAYFMGDHDPPENSFRISPSQIDVAAYEVVSGGNYFDYFFQAEGNPVFRLEYVNSDLQQIVESMQPLLDEMQESISSIEDPLLSADQCRSLNDMAREAQMLIFRFNLPYGVAEPVSPALQGLVNLTVIDDFSGPPGFPDDEEDPQDNDLESTCDRELLSSAITEIKSLWSMHREKFSFIAEKSKQTGIAAYFYSPWTVNTNDFYSFLPWGRVPNSSTNFNRKRAAYMLKTFLCDDLDPVNVEIDVTEHTENAHASDAACQSCHYKLDPMAGLFRYRGQYGVDFQNADTFIFDDDARLEGEQMAAYFNNWRKPNGDWDVGVYNAPNQPFPDWSGDDLSAFSIWAPNSEKVQQCMARRLFEYYVGEKQSVDGAWLNQISRTLSPAAGTPGLKEAVKTIVLSNSFMQHDPVAGECYDFAEGQETANRPPCEIAYIIEKNCHRCHEGGGFGLDTASWVQNGDDFSFAHVGDEGQLTVKESFERILERLTTNDRRRRMPRGTIDLNEQQKLVRWIEDQLNATQEGAR